MFLIMKNSSPPQRSGLEFYFDITIFIIDCEFDTILSNFESVKICIKSIKNHIFIKKMPLQV